MARRFSIGTAFSRGWEAFAKRPLFFVGLLLLVFVVGVALQIPAMIIDALTPNDMAKVNAATLSLFLISGWITLLFSLISWAVQQYLSTGVMRVSLDAVAGRPYTVKSLLVEPKLFLNAFL